MIYMSSIPLKRSKHAIFLECLKPYPHLEGIPKKGLRTCKRPNPEVE